MKSCLIALIFLLISIPLQARPQWPPAEVDTWIMSYDEIMRMTPENRRAYLIELRNIVIEFEKNSEDGMPAARSAADFHRFLDDLIFPSAYADTNCLDGETYRFHQCWLIANQRVAGYTCSQQTDSTFKCNRPSQSLPPVGTPANPANPAKPAPIVEKEPVAPAAPEAAVTPQAPVAPQAPAEVQQPPTAPSKMPVRTIYEAPSAQQMPHPPPPPIKETKSDSCKPVLKTCQSRNKYRKTFYSKKRACIFAGNVSSYPGEKPQRGKCSPVSQFEGNDKSCPSNQVICNPMIFGYSADKDGKLNTPICVPETSEATAACDKDKRAPKDNLNKLFEQGFDGLKEAFNKFVQDLKGVCNDDEASAQFHCNECNIAKKRLFALQSKFRGDLCKQLGGTSAPEPDPSNSTQ